MSGTIEQAQEGIEQAHHAHLAEAHGEGGHAAGGRHARWTAVLIAALAAALALGEMQEKGAQNAYLTHHISLSDDWGFYQAKNARATMREAEADILDSLPGAANDPALQKRAADARANAAHLRDDPSGDGMKQLLDKTRRQTLLRDEELHTYHRLEMVVGALQIAIVLASVSVVTRVRTLAGVAAAMGVAAAAFGLLVVFGQI